MKIIQLHAENFKRLGVVEIAPDGNVVTIGGKNGHGKSSVLDAIYVALRGRAVAPPQPIRKGQDKCTIRLDMGDIVVTRNFHQKEGSEYTDTLKVENADGLRYTKPDAMLRSLLGEIGFDPFEFVKLKPKDQAARLLEMVPLSIDLDEFRELDASDRTRRTEVNREVSRLTAQVAGIPQEEVPADIPDRDTLTDQLGNAANTNAAINREEQRREELARQLANMRRTAEMDRTRAEELRAEAAELIEAAKKKDEDAVRQDKHAQEHSDALDALPPLDEPVDTDVIRQQLRDAEAAQAIADRQARRKALADELKEAEARSEAFTKALNDRAAQRNAALAEAEMPVPGLSFALDEKGDPVLMWEGLPFDKDQISTAAQLRVSTAIGMAANPRLRVLRIMDGSLLDGDSMKMLAEMAEAEDFQLWVEVVGDGGVGIVMENGTVRGAAEPEPEAGEGEGEAEPAAKLKGRAKAKGGDKPEGSLL